MIGDCGFSFGGVGKASGHDVETVVGESFFSVLFSSYVILLTGSRVLESLKAVVKRSHLENDEAAARPESSNYVVSLFFFLQYN